MKLRKSVRNSRVSRVSLSRNEGVKEMPQGKLISFRAENYACFSDEAEISFQASSSLNDNDAPTESVSVKETKIDMLNRLVVLGANASGKTSILRSLQTLLGMITLEAGSLDYMSTVGFDPFNPFRFCEEQEEKPTRYEAIFFIKQNDEKEGNFYRYKISINKKSGGLLNIVEESLYEVSFVEDVYVDYKKIFNRNIDEGTTLGDFADNDFNGIVQKLNDMGWWKSLMLIMLAAIGIEPAKLIVNWCKNSSFFDNDELIMQEDLNERLSKDKYEWFKEFVEDKSEDSYLSIGQKILGKLDPSIQNIKFEPIMNNDRIISYDIRTLHSYSPKKGLKTNIEFPMSHESDGTKKLIYLLPKVLPILKNGGLFIVDELDAKFHPLLIKYFIQLFSDDTVNVGKAQIICSIHNGALLNFVRADEICFVQKNDKNKSEIFSLVDYYDSDERLKDKSGTVITNYNWYLDYLHGRYDGIQKNLLEASGI